MQLLLDFEIKYEKSSLDIEQDLLINYFAPTIKHYIIRKAISFDNPKELIAFESLTEILSEKRSSFTNKINEKPLNEIIESSIPEINLLKNTKPSTKTKSSESKNKKQLKNNLAAKVASEAYLGTIENSEIKPLVMQSSCVGDLRKIILTDLIYSKISREYTKKAVSPEETVAENLARICTIHSFEKIYENAEKEIKKKSAELKSLRKKALSIRPDRNYDFVLQLVLVKDKIHDMEKFYSSFHEKSIEDLGLAYNPYKNRKTKKILESSNSIIREIKSEINSKYSYAAKEASSYLDEFLEKIKTNHFSCPDRISELEDWISYMEKITEKFPEKEPLTKDLPCLIKRAEDKKTYLYDILDEKEALAARTSEIKSLGPKVDTLDYTQPSADFVNIIKDSRAKLNSGILSLSYQENKPYFSEMAEARSEIKKKIQNKIADSLHSLEESLDSITAYASNNRFMIFKSPSKKITQLENSKSSLAQIKSQINLIKELVYNE